MKKVSQLVLSIVLAWKRSPSRLIFFFSSRVSWLEVELDPYWAKCRATCQTIFLCQVGSPPKRIFGSVLLMSERNCLQDHWHSSKWVGSIPTCCAAKGFDREQWVMNWFWSTRQSVLFLFIWHLGFAKAPYRYKALEPGRQILSSVSGLPWETCRWWTSITEECLMSSIHVAAWFLVLYQSPQQHGGV